jgi:chorismate synthase
VAAGALARCLLRHFGIEAFGFVRSICTHETTAQVRPDNLAELKALRDASETYCPDPAASDAQKAAIRQAKIDKTTLGGLVEAHVFGCPPGLGSSMDWRDKLDARLAYAVMGIQAIKSVEIGMGRDVARRQGHEVHDPIAFDPTQIDSPCLGFTRPSNNAGGTEGGMTNGQPVIVRAAMKPIATLLRGMPSIDLNTKQDQASQYERSDVCAVSAASVVLENVAAFEVARVFRDKFAGDSLLEVRAQYEAFLKWARMLPLEPPPTSTRLA